MKIIEVNRDSEDILIYAKANFKSNGDYKARTATEEGYKQFAEYFKNIKFCCRNLETHCEEVKYTDSSTFIEYHRQTRSFCAPSDRDAPHSPYSDSTPRQSADDHPPIREQTGNPLVHILSEYSVSVDKSFFIQNKRRLHRRNKNAPLNHDTDSPPLTLLFSTFSPIS